MNYFLDHIAFYAYYRKKKSICSRYRNLRKNKVLGYLEKGHYKRSLQHLRNAAIELELEYFDILYLRLR
ncbi:hypothetical protein [Flagellimonas pelagia]|uniref:Uncharacterized protein n=1 Tax=Flagellimonas pelagia TaxID=2306998 RepID=A0ABY3KDJ4_9FLAO|nr:hypothetical protein [Allomuricauda maritima]TXJ91070.1 hypothetical protein FQ017_18850 [Allomuricauda maritima]